nr:hypothetical protein GCM10020093_010670 [Planobispora longispora]
MAERITRELGPIAVAEVELLLGWGAEHRALFADPMQDSTFRPLAPLPDLRGDSAACPATRPSPGPPSRPPGPASPRSTPGRSPTGRRRRSSPLRKTIGRAVRLALFRDEAWLPGPLDRLVRGVAVAPTSAKTLPSQGVLFEVAHAAESHPTPEAVSALRTARRITRHAGVTKQLDRMLKRIEPVLADRLEVAFRLPDGRVRQTVGEHTAVISIEDGVELSWWHGDKKLKTVPAAVRREHPDEVKRLREQVKQVRQQQATLARALETGYASEDGPPYRQLEGRPITDRLIWEFEVSPACGGASWG